ncbi:MAG: hypothetical protein Q8R20_01485 [Nanoarchaeota archaeon]|nr:hypothetical protein [Nanoarchaeota archaeon]
MVHRVVYRVAEFFQHWYVGGFRTWWNFVAHSVAWFDRSFGWRVTVKHLFQPLYKDFSALGYILGVPYRVARFFVGLVFYVVFLFFAASIFLLWLCVPPYLLVRIIFG